MSQVPRVATVWSGTPVVGGGVSVMYCTVGGEGSLQSAYRTFLDSIKTLMPSSLQWTFPGAGPIINQESGHLESAWSNGTPPAALAGTNAGQWANGVGVRIKWTTGAFYGGRAVVGSTFIVPLVINAYEGAGNITSAYLTSLQSAATTFVAAAGLRVYCKPRTGLVGQSFAVNGAIVPDAVSWLQGRRT
mgnify:CR=1 FL=1